METEKVIKIIDDFIVFTRETVNKMKQDEGINNDYPFQTFFLTLSVLQNEGERILDECGFEMTRPELTKLARQLQSITEQALEVFNPSGTSN